MEDHLERKLQKVIDDIKPTLIEGRECIATANDNPRLLGLALQSFHGALENHFRASLVGKVPAEDQEDIFDTTVTNWDKLLALGKIHLGLSDQDFSLIKEANRYRNSFTHPPKKWLWNKESLLKYIQFVENWCSREINNSTTQSARRISSSNPTNVLRSVTSYETDFEPYPFWRSSCFLWLTFFFFNPLWALLILTDKHQSGCLKFFVGLIYSGVIILWLLALSNQSKAPNYVSEYTNEVSNPSTESVDTISLQIEPEVTKTTKKYSCTIIWEKYSDSRALVNMNRSMVWDDIVSNLVDGSGMTPREFYDQVVERNPSLAVDGYVFKEGTVYVLPSCE